MKRITLFTALLFVSLIGFSQAIIECPFNYRANNGNNGGCDARLTFDFATCQDGITVVALLDANDVVIEGLTFVNSGTCANGDLVVCITGNNIPPAGTLKVKFAILDLTTPDPTDTIQAFCNVPVASGPLPVTLSSFIANRKSSQVSLTWKTEVELNSKEFIIQRKTGTTWEDIATVKSANSSIGSSYTYTDINSNKGITEYRLKMLDFDGSSKNSDIRAVKGTSATADFTVYPTPSTGTATVVLTEKCEKASVQLIDNAGRVIKNENIVNNSSTNFRNLTPGMYMIRVTNSVTGEIITKKLPVVQ